MSKFSDRSDWFSLWSADQESMLATMVRNLSSDLEAGYQATGTSVGGQIADIADYRSHLLARYNRLRNMTNEQRDRWCFEDMKRRGVIA